MLVIMLPFIMLPFIMLLVIMLPFIMLLVIMLHCWPVMSVFQYVGNQGVWW